MIYKKHPNENNRIQAFINEDEIGAYFANWIDLTKNEITAYELMQAKIQKKNQIELEYENSKLECTISYQGQIYSRVKGLNDAIKLTTEWADQDSEDVVFGVLLTRKQCYIFKELLLKYRGEIASNVEISKAEIDALKTKELVEQYIPSRVIVIPKEIKLENLNIN